jgi:5,10-methylenetetrahydrofolate reductase
MSLLETVRTMRDESRFLSGRKITSPPHMFIGAAENPFAPPTTSAASAGQEGRRGRAVVQTQYCFDLPI